MLTVLMKYDQLCTYLYEQQVHFEIKLSLCIIIIIVMFFNHDRHRVSSEIKL